MKIYKWRRIVYLTSPVYFSLLALYLSLSVCVYMSAEKEVKSGLQGLIRLIPAQFVPSPNLNHGTWM